MKGLQGHCKYKVVLREAAYFEAADCITRQEHYAGFSPYLRLSFLNAGISQGYSYGYSRGAGEDQKTVESAAEDASEAPESEQEDLWDKLLSAPRPQENAKASNLRQTISQVASSMPETILISLHAITVIIAFFI